MKINGISEPRSGLTIDGSFSLPQNWKIDFPSMSIYHLNRVIMIFGSFSYQRVLAAGSFFNRH